MTTQDLANNGDLAENVMQSLGEPAEAAQEINDPATLEGTSNNTEPAQDPLYVQKRLKQQSRKHEREMREMQAQIAAMQQGFSPSAQSSQLQDQPTGPLGVEDQIQKAVQYALNHREMQERKQREAESAAHVQKQYQGMQKHLEELEDKYDDFHDTVFGDDKPYTATMRDYAMTLPKKGAGSAGEVLYHLGQNPEELKRISKLHPLDQAAEMAKLSHALISGGEVGKASTPRVPMGHVKSNPTTTSNGTTDRTPVANIRAQMKAGKWK